MPSQPFSTRSTAVTSRYCKAATLIAPVVICLEPLAPQSNSTTSFSSSHTSRTCVFIISRKFWLGCDGINSPNSVSKFVHSNRPVVSAPYLRFAPRVTSRSLATLPILGRELSVNSGVTTYLTKKAHVMRKRKPQACISADMGFRFSKQMPNEWHPAIGCGILLLVRKSGFLESMVIAAMKIISYISISRHAKLPDPYSFQQSAQISEIPRLPVGSAQFPGFQRKPSQIVEKVSITTIADVAVKVAARLSEYYREVKYAPAV